MLWVSELYILIVPIFAKLLGLDGDRSIRVDKRLAEQVLEIGLINLDHGDLRGCELVVTIPLVFEFLEVAPE